MAIVPRFEVATIESIYFIIYYDDKIIKSRGSDINHKL